MSEESLSRSVDIGSSIIDFLPANYVDFKDADISEKSSLRSKQYDKKDESSEETSIQSVEIGSSLLDLFPLNFVALADGDIPDVKLRVSYFYNKNGDLSGKSSPQNAAVGSSTSNFFPSNYTVYKNTDIVEKSLCRHICRKKSSESREESPSRSVEIGSSLFDFYPSNFTFHKEVHTSKSSLKTAEMDEQSRSGTFEIDVRTTSPSRAGIVKYDTISGDMDDKLLNLVDSTLIRITDNVSDRRLNDSLESCKTMSKLDDVASISTISVDKLVRNVLSPIIDLLERNFEIDTDYLNSSTIVKSNYSFITSKRSLDKSEPTNTSGSVKDRPPSVQSYVKAESEVSLPKSSTSLPKSTSSLPKSATSLPKTVTSQQKIGTAASLPFSAAAQPGSLPTSVIAQPKADSMLSFHRSSIALPEVPKRIALTLLDKVCSAVKLDEHIRPEHLQTLAFGDRDVGDLFNILNEEEQTKFVLNRLRGMIYSVEHERVHPVELEEMGKRLKRFTEICYGAGESKPVERIPVPFSAAEVDTFFELAQTTDIDSTLQYCHRMEIPSVMLTSCRNARISGVLAKEKIEELENFLNNFVVEIEQMKLPPSKWGQLIEVTVTDLADVITKRYPEKILNLIEYGDIMRISILELASSTDLRLVAVVVSSLLEVINEDVPTIYIPTGREQNLFISLMQACIGCIKRVKLNDKKAMQPTQGHLYFSKDVECYSKDDDEAMPSPKVEQLIKIASVLTLVQKDIDKTSYVVLITLKTAIEKVNLILKEGSFENIDCNELKSLIMCAYETAILNERQLNEKSLRSLPNLKSISVEIRKVLGVIEEVYNDLENNNEEGSIKSSDGRKDTLDCFVKTMRQVCSDVENSRLPLKKLIILNNEIIKWCINTALVSPESILEMTLHNCAMIAGNRFLNLLREMDHQDTDTRNVDGKRVEELASLFLDMVRHISVCTPTDAMTTIERSFVNMTTIMQDGNFVVGKAFSEALMQSVKKKLESTMANRKESTHAKDTARTISNIVKLYQYDQFEAKNSANILANEDSSQCPSKGPDVDTLVDVNHVPRSFEQAQEKAKMLIDLLIDSTLAGEFSSVETVAAVGSGSAFRIDECTSSIRSIVLRFIKAVSQKIAPANKVDEMAASCAADISRYCTQIGLTADIRSDCKFRCGPSSATPSDGISQTSGQLLRTIERVIKEAENLLYINRIFTSDLFSGKWPYEFTSIKRREDVSEELTEARYLIKDGLDNAARSCSETRASLPHGKHADDRTPAGRLTQVQYIGEVICATLRRIMGDMETAEVTEDITKDLLQEITGVDSRQRDRSESVRASVATLCKGETGASNNWRRRSQYIDGDKYVGPRKSLTPYYKKRQTNLAYKQVLTIHCDRISDTLTSAAQSQSSIVELKTLYSILKETMTIINGILLNLSDNIFVQH